MKKLILAGLIALALVFGCGYDEAKAASAPDLSAAAYVLMSADTGEILNAANADVKRYPASTTKIMTLVLALEAVDSGKVSLDDMVSTSEYAASMGGSQVYLEAGEQRSLKEMLIGIAVGSGNDACVAVGEFLGGTMEGFVQMMNDKAAALGMENTHFANPHGLHDDNHYTTAGDMAKLAYYALKNTDILTYTSIYEYQFRPEPKPLVLWNTNKLLKWYEGADGLKTGYTSQAGRNLVATAKRGDTRLITVVMGVEAKNGHYNESIQLLDFGFNSYEYQKLYQKGQAVASVPVARGAKSAVEAILADDAGVMADKTSNAQYSSQVVIDRKPTAPLAAGDVLGRMEILKDGDIIETIDLVAAEGIEKLSLAQSFLRSFRRILLFN
jgi:D-alanyl-D-alanine carboxypeptidase (penicillin-binding protein 5/6)